MTATRPTEALADVIDTRSDKATMSRRRMRRSQSRRHTFRHFGMLPDETYKLYLAERNIYGSSRIGTEKVNLEMNEASLQGYLPLDPSATIGIGALCTTTGEWYYEQTSTTGSLLDLNTDGNQDIRFSDAALASTGYSAQIGAHVVRGATYTLDFDLLNKTNIDLFSFEVRDCVSGTIYINQVVASAGHASAVFTVPYDKSDQVRIKWLAQKHNSFTTARFTISQISLDGEGTEFDVMAAAQYGAVAHVIGDKYYEVANHLGNVLEVIRDIKLASNGGSGSVVAYSQPDVVSYSDYYPYGMQMPGRHDENVYRYGFQGQEKDDEIKGGEGTSLNYEYRMYDPRIGRFFAVDPLSSKYPYYSPYAFSGNRVIDSRELEGLEPENIHYYNVQNNEDKSHTIPDKPKYSSDVLTLHGDNAFLKDSKSGAFIPIEGESTYMQQDAASVNVYTYWNSDGTIEKEVVQSSNNKINNFSARTPAKETTSTPSTQDVALAGASQAIGMGKAMGKEIVTSRTGITSGSLKGSSRIYNKASTRVVVNGLTILGHVIAAYGVVDTGIQYEQNNISGARASYNLVNAGVTTAVPVLGIPIAAGDYLGQRYAPEIEHQVTEGEASQALVWMFRSFGLDVSPYNH